RDAECDEHHIEGEHQLATDGMVDPFHWGILRILFYMYEKDCLSSNIFILRTFNLYGKFESANLIKTNISYIG
ncbi:hypothetical protein U5N25_15210, partial [Exiguobacterium indicum]|uniref:hypothetical protein n=1 Tax=Exiguobacterium indicum TaxID=296995 RepID=UPI0039790219